LSSHKGNAAYRGEKRAYKGVKQMTHPVRARLLGKIRRDLCERTPRFERHIDAMDDKTLVTYARTYYADNRRAKNES